MFSLPSPLETPRVYAAASWKQAGGSQRVESQGSCLAIVARLWPQPPIAPATHGSQRRVLAVAD